jgi:hypothetical protein
MHRLASVLYIQLSSDVNTAPYGMTVSTRRCARIMDPPIVAAPTNVHQTTWTHTARYARAFVEIFQSGAHVLILHDLIASRFAASRYHSQLPRAERYLKGRL